ncbi:hypothetical protein V8G54_031779 [Vigna mungo]|uniref:Uncharacterized protein n=1 Tax=Vigna mungo TaxID=3915 RepID=A0AAQ3MKN4_VIGMU
MMECIRRQLMTWFNERRENSMQWTSILVLQLRELLLKLLIVRGHTRYFVPLMLNLKLYHMKEQTLLILGPVVVNVVGSSSMVCLVHMLWLLFSLLGRMCKDSQKPVLLLQTTEIHTDHTPNS